MWKQTFVQSSISTVCFLLIQLFYSSKIQKTKQSSILICRIVVGGLWQNSKRQIPQTTTTRDETDETEWERVWMKFRVIFSWVSLEKLWNLLFLFLVDFVRGRVCATTTLDGTSSRLSVMPVNLSNDDDDDTHTHSEMRQLNYTIHFIVFSIHFCFGCVEWSALTRSILSIVPSLSHSLPLFALCVCFILLFVSRNLQLGVFYNFAC